MTKTFMRRLDDLEKKQDTKDIPLWIVLEDGEPVPEGMEHVKRYSPLANPDSWDADDSLMVTKKREGAKDGKND